MKKENSEIPWPELPFEKWNDTIEALHMKMQVVGKIKLALTPFLNHWWNVAFYISANGINSGPIPYKNIIFELNFDFTRHSLNILSSDNQNKIIPLDSCSVAEFYHELMSALDSMGIDVVINKIPSEVPDPVPCDIDGRSSYNKEFVSKWWEILLQSSKIFERFRSDFRGKASPVHFFWGSFDLCGSRFSGGFCSPPLQSGRIMQFAENEENFTFGFWAGNKNYPKPAFYSYIYPPPKGIESVKPEPKEAIFNTTLGEFILDYDDARKSESPEDAIMDFLQNTYKESAKLAGWDIEKLKQVLPANISDDLKS